MPSLQQNKTCYSRFLVMPLIRQKELKPELIDLVQLDLIPTIIQFHTTTAENKYP